MKGVIGRVALALLFAAAGGLFWAVGRLEERVVEQYRQLATLANDEALPAEADAEPSVGYIGRVPWVADRLAEMRWQRAMMQYWLSGDLAGVAGRPGEKDARIQLMMANAQYHAARRDATDRQALLRKLDSVIKSYTDVLKDSPEQIDAAYNYEYVARERNAFAKRTDGRTRAREEVNDGPSGGRPWKPTLWGKEGEPPPGTNMNQFRMLSPMRPDERDQESGEAGKGGAKVRKG